jgi:hypothetical protein
VTPREVFEKVAAHLLAQGRRSVRYPESSIDDSQCMYRGEGGLKCAAGALISDEAYSIVLEWKSVKDDNVWSALVKSGVPNDPNTRGMIGRLQNLHDYEEPESWSASLDILRTRFFPEEAP